MEAAEGGDGERGEVLAGQRRRIKRVRNARPVQSTGRTGRTGRIPHVPGHGAGDPHQPVAQLRLGDAGRDDPRPGEGTPAQHRGRHGARDQCPSRGDVTGGHTDQNLAGGHPQQRPQLAGAGLGAGLGIGTARPGVTLQEQVDRALFDPPEAGVVPDVDGVCRH